MSNYLVKEITARETWAVRHPVLRTGRPLETCAMEGDDHPDTFHLGLFDQASLIGVVSFMNAAKPQFTGSQYQLRGMGVLAACQGKNLGALLIKAGEQKLKTLGIDVLWCNARIKALNFYLRNDFIVEGDSFEIESVGTHYLLYKTL